MTRPELGPDANDPIRELLHDAVSDVEPKDSLDAIRNRTKVTTMSSRRPWIYGVAGAVVATAATIAAVTMVGNAGDDSADPQPAGTPSNSRATDQATEQSSDDATPSRTDPPAGGSVAVPVYYLGDTPYGTRLYREFHSLEITDDDRLPSALEEAVEGDPMDPDYTSPWPDGTTVADASYDGSVITVDLAAGDQPLRDKPAGMSDHDATMAIQQVVYTAQAAVRDGRKPVRLLVDGQPSDQVLGQAIGAELSNGKVLETLSLVSITAPREGVEVSGTFTATGVANSFEATVPWQVLKDGKVVLEYSTTAKGAYGNKLWAWEAQIDVSKLEPGSYVFRAATDDPTGGSEGNGPYVDTRTIVVK